jgi:hypothetical protein
VPTKSPHNKFTKEKAFHVFCEGFFAGSSVLLSIN